jgi:hypothetical protein
VAWRQGERANSFPTGETVNAVVSLRENIWNEKRNLEFIAEDIRMAEQFNFQASASFNETPLMIAMGKPASDAHVIKTLEDLHTTSATTFHIQDLPLSLSTQATKEFSSFFTQHSAISTQPNTTAQTSQVGTPQIPNPKSQIPFFFDIGSTKLHDLDHLATDFPTLNEVRKGFVFLQRGQGLPYSHLKTERIMTVLQELELLSEQGKPYRGQKRDPYSSETLMTGLLERYKLQTFIKAYKYLDDTSFAQTVKMIFLATET